MNESNKMPSKRTQIRIVSFSIAILAVLGGGAVSEYLRAEKYRKQLEYTYMRSLDELSTYVTDISNTLTKGVYANSNAQMANLSAKLWRDSASAKAAMTSLPLAELQLNNTYKFLSQVGDYAMSLSRKMNAQQELTAEEKANLESLCKFGRTLNDHISNVEQSVASGAINLDTVARQSTARKNGAEDSGDEGNSDSSFKEMENSFDGYPKLIYDGPFSDHLTEKQPAMTEGAKGISQQQALEKAMTAAGKNANLKFDQMENSKMPLYCFVGNGIDVGVTKQGGYLAYMINARDVGESTIGAGDAVKKAKDYLKSLGIENMRETYYEIANNICTINFAYMQGDVTCYTDLIKVGIAMDTNEVVSFDARGFIVNHKERSLPQAKITRDKALQSVSKNLTVQSSKMALIPTSGMNEVLAHEIKATGKNGEHILVYVNAITGAEEQILILIENKNGVLTV